MKITTYQQEAKRTCPNLENKTLDRLHMRMGVITELAECIDICKKHIAYGKTFDKVHMAEEIGDAMWYIVNDATFEKVKINEELCWNYRDEHEDIRDVAHIASSLSDVMIGFLERDELGLNYDELIPTLIRISEYINVPFDDILENNINKLKVRFPEKFEGSLAIDRNVELEKVVFNTK